MYVDRTQVYGLGTHPPVNGLRAFSREGADVSLTAGGVILQQLPLWIEQVIICATVCIGIEGDISRNEGIQRNIREYQTLTHARMP